MEDREFTRPGPEFPPPGPEFSEGTASAREREFGKLPPEYGAFGAPGEPVGRRKRLRRAFFTLAVGALTVFLLFRSGVVPAPRPPAIPAPPAPTASAAPTSTPAPVPTATPAPTPAPTPEPTPEPLPAWPLGDGTILVTVYNNTFDFTNVDWDNFSEEDVLRILLREEIPEKDFTSLTLPEPEPDADDPDWDYEFAGYVLHYGNEFDAGFDPTSRVAPFARAVGETLTREQVEWVPPGADGVRYVNVHVLWRSGAEPGEMALILSDGLGHTERYDPVTPYASEGYAYLAAYPAPEREGYVFTGWYDAEGNPVEFVSYFDFFDEIKGDDGYLDYDWQHPHPVTLTAGWEKARG